MSKITQSCCCKVQFMSTWTSFPCTVNGAEFPKLSTSWRNASMSIITGHTLNYTQLEQRSQVDIDGFYLTTDRFFVSPPCPVALMSVPRGAPGHSLGAQPGFTSSTSLKLITQLWRAVGNLPKTYRSLANVCKPLSPQEFSFFSILWQWSSLL